MLEMVGCSRLPGSHMSVAWLTANVQGTIWTRSKHRVHLIQHMHSVHGRRLGVIPSKRAFWGGSSSSREVVVLAGRSGSSCTRAIVEVDILATEVVHVSRYLSNP